MCSERGSFQRLGMWRRLLHFGWPRFFGWRRDVPTPSAVSVPHDKYEPSSHKMKNPSLFPKKDMILLVQKTGNGQIPMEWATTTTPPQLPTMQQSSRLVPNFSRLSQMQTHNFPRTPRSPTAKDGNKKPASSSSSVLLCTWSMPGTPGHETGSLEFSIAL